MFFYCVRKPIQDFQFCALYIYFHNIDRMYRLRGDNSIKCCRCNLLIIAVYVDIGAQ